MKKIPLSPLAWCDASSRVIDLKNILEFIEKKKNICEIHVGCDSHLVGGKYVFALVIALYEPQKGGTYFFARKRLAQKTLRSLKVRLLRETEEAIAVADMIASSIVTDKLSVHLDINPNKRYKSHQVFTSATSWVKSQGYNCLVKPDAWASSWLADAYAK